MCVLVESIWIINKFLLENLIFKVVKERERRVLVVKIMSKCEMKEINVILI